jgi:hypothetical protein
MQGDEKTLLQRKSNIQEKYGRRRTLHDTAYPRQRTIGATTPLARRAKGNQSSMTVPLSKKSIIDLQKNCIGENVLI